MACSSITTISQLYKKDLNQAYLLFDLPLSYQKRSRVLTQTKDGHLSYWKRFSMSFTCVAGDALPVLTDQPPPEFLALHWKTWLADGFPPAQCIRAEDGLRHDGVPIVTLGSFESIPKSRHIIDPDILQRLQRKSCIPEIGVPCPRHMNPTKLQYPCVIKPDLGILGHGICKADNEQDMLSMVNELRNKHSYNGKVIYQDYIPGIKEIKSHLFYLTKSCEIIWLGTNSTFTSSNNQFAWSSMAYDYNVQDEQRSIDYDEFVIPLSNFLHQAGYFGVANFEIVVNDSGRYLVDLNVRLGGETAHHLIAPLMAKRGLTFSYLLDIYSVKDVEKRSPKELVEIANQLNQSHQDCCIIIGGVNDSMDTNFESLVSIFGKSKQHCELAIEQLKQTT